MRSRHAGRAPRVVGPLCLLLLALAAEGLASTPPGATLRQRVEALRGGLAVEAGGDPLIARQALPQFYEGRSFELAWTDAQASELTSWIAGAGRWGLEPTDYHWRALGDPVAERPGPAGRVDRDLLLTDGFLLLASHLVSGRVHPGTFDPEWIAVQREVDVVAALARALSGAGVGATLDDLQPHNPGYWRLAEALSAYREIETAGGWTLIPEGERMEIGSEGVRVALLRRRLAWTDPGVPPDGPLFDEALREGVIRFQRRHGLTADGKVGPMTLKALNVTAGERARQIELNLERWRWLPIELGRSHVMVNLPAYTLDAVVDGRLAETMRVIVGRPYRRTPVFSDLMRYVVFNPAWEVPPSLAVQDKLPLIQKDPSYLEVNGFRVLSGWGTEERVIDPQTVDWSALSRSRFPYRLRQDPGPLNALGRVKFMFPNAFNVYLHDTPSRELFRVEERSLSSGCIRLERPIDLAELVLSETAGWDRARIDEALRSKQTVTVHLTRPMPVHLQHFTAWVETDGAVAFRADLYDRDERLDLALRSRIELLSGGPR